MKTILLFSCCFVLLFNGCSKTVTIIKEEPIEPTGIWSDIIKFSTQDLSFNAEGGTLVVTSEGNDWVISGLLDSCDVGHYYPLYVRCPEEWEIPNITYLCDDFGKGTNWSQCSKLEGEWFSITRENLKKVVFTVKPNDTGKSRLLRLHTSAGNFFASIKVTQAE